MIYSLHHLTHDKDILSEIDDRVYIYLTSFLFY